VQTLAETSVFAVSRKAKTQPNILHLRQKKPRSLNEAFSMKFVPAERVKYLRYEIFAAQM